MSIHPVPPQEPDSLKKGAESFVDSDAITEAWAQALKADKRAGKLFKELDTLRGEVKARVQQSDLMRHVANVLSATVRVDQLASMLLDVLQSEFGASQGLVWTLGGEAYEARAGMHFDRKQLQSLHLPVPHPFPSYPVLIYQSQWLEPDLLPPALRLIQSRQDQGLFFVPFEHQTLLVGFAILALSRDKVFLSAEQESLEVLQRLFASALHDTWLLQELQRQKEFLAKEKEDLKVQAAALEHQNQLLRQGQTFKVEFLGYAAGELRAQLLGILNLLGRVRETAGLEVEARETLLLDALLAGKHMAELLRDLAELARPSASGLPMEVRPLDLGGLLRELQPLVESFPRRGGGALGWPELPELPEVLADRSALAQILLSLIAGALRGSPDGNLRIWVEREPMSLSLCLLLPGLHIGRGTGRRILRPEDFYIQGQSGAGLGLVICGQLMDAMGGTLVIDPAGEDQGTVIGLELALA